MVALNWGILGAGNIGRSFTRGVAKALTGGTVLAVASRDRRRADAFADELDVPRRYGSYDELLADRDLDAIYVATPHPEHLEWAVAAARAKKHVLCEKPLGVNAAQAEQIIAAARENHVFLMEAFMYRCHPQIARVLDLIRAGSIGQVRMVQATFGFHFPFDAAHRLYNPALAGGGILDVGCYPVSFARLIAGAASGKDFLDPVDLVGTGKLNDVTRVDEYAAAVLRFDNDVIAQVACSVGVEQANVARVYGTAGSIYLPEPWTASVEGQPAMIVLQHDGKAPESLTVPAGWLYGMEAEVVAANLSRRQAPSPAMSWADTLGNMRTLDRWRAAVGVTYPGE